MIKLIVITFFKDYIEKSIIFQGSNHEFTLKNNISFKEKLKLCPFDCDETGE